MFIPRPLPADYCASFGGYLRHVPGGDILEILASQGEETIALLEDIGDADARFRYDDGKWSLKQVLGHLIDTERVLLYRAMAAARGDLTRQPGFDQDAWEAMAPHDELDLEDLLEEFWLVRSTTLHFFRTVDADALTRRGVSGGGRRFTVGAMAWIIAGHEAHHLNVIDEKYLPGLP